MADMELKFSRYFECGVDEYGFYRRDKGKLISRLVDMIFKGDLNLEVKYDSSPWLSENINIYSHNDLIQITTGYDPKTKNKHCTLLVNGVIVLKATMLSLSSMIMEFTFDNLRNCNNIRKLWKVRELVKSRYPENIGSRTIRENLIIAEMNRQDKIKKKYEELGYTNDEEQGSSSGQTMMAVRKIGEPYDR